jgi:lycopene beta-cyclase
MTYFGVLFTFILPPLLILAIIVPRDLWGKLARRQPVSRAMLYPYWIILVHVLLALIYTTPWDNYLVATGVWWYDPELVTGITLGYVPIEEYTFFIVQTLLTGLWTLAVLRRLANSRPAVRPSPRLRLGSSLVVAAIWLVSTVLLLSGWKPGTYLTLILSWALVPVLIQVVFGADILRAHWRELLISILVPTIYLWLVDSLAIASGTWVIDPQQTTGLAVGGLPIEEMLFFLMTNLIIGFGMILMLASESQPRAQEWLGRFRRWGQSRKSLSGDAKYTPIARAAILAWLLALIATPISIWVFGEGVFPWMASLGVIIQLAAVLFSLRTAWPWRRILASLAAIAAFTWAVEFLGSATGFPFGDYSYTQAMQPQLGGVPVIIPLAWGMMLIPAWAVSQVILQPYHSRLGSAYPFIFAAVSGLAFTAWDLYLDPQMVARGLWEWDSAAGGSFAGGSFAGGYFGIPWSNYLGWWVSSTLLTLLLRPVNLPAAPLLMIYTLTWLFQAMGLGVFWGQSGPALTGFIGMGFFALWAWRQIKEPWVSVLSWLPFSLPASKQRPTEPDSQQEYPPDYPPEYPPGSKHSATTESN